MGRIDHGRSVSSSVGRIGTAGAADGYQVGIEAFHV